MSAAEFELRARDERLGGQRPPAGERVLPCCGVIKQIEKLGVKREIEADRHGIGHAGREQQAGDALSPRIRVGRARHGLRRRDAR